MLSGVLALALLEAATSSTQAAGRVGKLFDAVASTAAHVLSPKVPAIPDLRQHGGASTTEAQSTSSTSSGSSTLPADWNTSASSLYV